MTIARVAAAVGGFAVAYSYPWLRKLCTTLRDPEGRRELAQQIAPGSAGAVTGAISSELLFRNELPAELPREVATWLGTRPGIYVPAGAKRNAQQCSMAAKQIGLKDAVVIPQKRATKARAIGPGMSVDIR